MFLNSTHVFCLTSELKDELLGLRIREVLISSDQRELLFSLGGKNKEISLFFSAHSENCRVELWGKDEIEKRKEDYQKTNLLLFSVGGFVQKVEQIDFDRVIRISCEKKTQFGTGQRFNLIFELTGRNSNVIVVKKDGGVVDCLRKVDSDRSRFRQILPGGEYVPPPPPKKRNPFSISQKEFGRVIFSSNKPLRDCLSFNFMGADELLSRRIFHQTGLDPKVEGSELSVENVELLWKTFSHIFGEISKHHLDFQIILEQNGDPKGISCVDLPSIPDGQKIMCESLNAALKSFFSIKQEREEQKRELHKLSLVVQRPLKKLHERKKKIESDLEQAKRFEQFKRFGDLLMMNNEKIKKGQSSAALVDIFGSEHSEIEIPLDVKLSPMGNAQRYFKKHKKAKEGLKIITRRHSETEDKIIDLEQISERLEKQREEGNLEEIRRELIRFGLLSAQALGKDGKSSLQKSKEKKPQFRIFITESGAEILVGRNNRENDQLTFKFARPDDLWFHAQDVPGSHVLLRRKDKKTEPSHVQIKEAAKVAAYYSKAREEKKAMVVYTQAKYVRKPKKGKPGLALVEREKSILVEPGLPERNP